MKKNFLENFGGIISDTVDSTKGVRCIKICDNNLHLACGGRNGNIGIFDLSQKYIKKIFLFEAHDCEVLCLEYTNSSKSIV